MTNKTLVILLILSNLFSMAILAFLVFSHYQRPLIYQQELITFFEENIFEVTE